MNAKIRAIEHFFIKNMTFEAVFSLVKCCKGHGSAVSLQMVQ